MVSNPIPLPRSPADPTLDDLSSGHETKVYLMSLLPLKRVLVLVLLKNPLSFHIHIWLRLTFAMFRLFFSRIFLLFILCQTSIAAFSSCARVYGAYINPHDCDATIRSLTSTVTGHNGSPSLAWKHMFSRDPSLAHWPYQMRRTFIHGTCGLGIDLVDPLPPSKIAESNWLEFLTHFSMLILKCAYQPGAIGGVSKFGWFEVTLFNPIEEHVQDVLQLPQTLDISFSTAIRTKHMDRHLDADGKGTLYTPHHRPDPQGPGLPTGPHMGPRPPRHPDSQRPISPDGPQMALGAPLNPLREAHLAHYFTQLHVQTGFSSGTAPNFAHGQAPPPQAPLSQAYYSAGRQQLPFQGHQPGPGRGPYPQKRR